MSKALYKKSRATDIDNLPLETLDYDENNDDELVECVKEVTNTGKQIKPKKCLKPRIIRSVWFNVESHPKNITVNLLCFLLHGEMKKQI